MITLETVKDRIQDFVRDRSAIGGCVTGAQVHADLMTRFPQFNYRVLGFERLGDLFRQMAAQNLINYDPHGSHDRLCPKEKQMPLFSANTPTSGYTRRIRPDLWRAFSLFDRIQRYYIPASDSVVEVENGGTAIPIPDEREHAGWLLQFLIERGYDREMADKLVSQHDWYYLLSSPSSPVKPIDQMAWKSLRFERIVDKIQAWQRANSLVFSIFSSSTPLKSSSSKVRRTEGGDDLRVCLIRALETMPTHELMRLPIPFVYLQPFLKTGPS